MSGRDLKFDYKISVSSFAPRQKYTTLNCDGSRLGTTIMRYQENMSMKYVYPLQPICICDGSRIGTYIYSAETKEIRCRNERNMVHYILQPHHIFIRVKAFVFMLVQGGHVSHY